MENYSSFSCCQRFEFRELFLEMPPKRVFRETKNAKEEKDYLDSYEVNATKWAYKIFGELQSPRRNENANFEERGFEVEVDSIKTNIVEMSAESLNFWLTKFASGVYKENGERYPSRSLCSICYGLQRHLQDSNGSDAIKFLNKSEPR